MHIYVGVYAYFCQYTTITKHDFESHLKVLDLMGGTPAGRVCTTLLLAGLWLFASANVV